MRKEILFLLFFLSGLALFSPVVSGFDSNANGFDTIYAIGPSGGTDIQGGYDGQYVAQESPIGSSTFSGFDTGVGPCYGGVCPLGAGGGNPPSFYCVLYPIFIVEQEIPQRSTATRNVKCFDINGGGEITCPSEPTWSIPTPPNTDATVEPNFDDPLTGDIASGFVTYRHVVTANFAEGVSCGSTFRVKDVNGWSCWVSNSTLHQAIRAPIYSQNDLQANCYKFGVPAQDDKPCGPSTIGSWTWAASTVPNSTLSETPGDDRFASYSPLTENTGYVEAKDSRKVCAAVGINSTSQPGGSGWSCSMLITPNSVPQNRNNASTASVICFNDGVQTTCPSTPLWDVTFPRNSDLVLTQGMQAQISSGQVTHFHAVQASFSEDFSCARTIRVVDPSGNSCHVSDTDGNTIIQTNVGEITPLQANCQSGNNPESPCNSGTIGTWAWEVNGPPPRASVDEQPSDDRFAYHSASEAGEGFSFSRDATKTCASASIDASNAGGGGGTPFCFVNAPNVMAVGQQNAPISVTCLDGNGVPMPCSGSVLWSEFFPQNGDFTFADRNELSTFLTAGSVTYLHTIRASFGANSCTKDIMVTTASGNACWNSDSNGQTQLDLTFAEEAPVTTNCVHTGFSTQCSAASPWDWDVRPQSLGSLAPGGAPNDYAGTFTAGIQPATGWFASSSNDFSVCSAASVTVTNGRGFGFCGNGVCDTGECTYCTQDCAPQDCGGNGVCGNNACEYDECNTCNPDCTPVDCPYTPPVDSSSSVLRIEGNVVVTNETLSKATITLLYNYASTGLAADGDAADSITLTVFKPGDQDSVTVPVEFTGKRGVFKAVLTPGLFGLMELPEGEYRTIATVMDPDGNTYGASEPRAVILVKQKKALPDINPLFALLVGFVALYAMRSFPARKRK